jgi:hypothetical protein
VRFHEHARELARMSPCADAYGSPEAEMYMLRAHPLVMQLAGGCELVEHGHGLDEAALQLQCSQIIRP